MRALLHPPPLMHVDVLSAHSKPFQERRRMDEWWLWGLRSDALFEEFQTTSTRLRLDARISMFQGWVRIFSEDEASGLYRDEGESILLEVKKPGIPWGIFHWGDETFTEAFAKRWEWNQDWSLWCIYRGFFRGIFCAFWVLLTPRWFYIYEHAWFSMKTLSWGSQRLGGRVVHNHIACWIYFEWINEDKQCCYGPSNRFFEYRLSFLLSWCLMIYDLTRQVAFRWLELLSSIHQ